MQVPRTAARRLRKGWFRAAGWRPGLRAGVVAGSGLVVIGLAVAVAWSAAENLRRSATESAIRTADSIVRGYLDPILDADSLDLSAAPHAAVQQQLERLVAGNDLQRINLWTRDGRIMYSTDARLVGMRFDIDGTLAAAFTGATQPVPGGHGSGSLGDLPDHILGIYAPIRGSTDGSPIGVFEVDIDAGPVEAQVDQSRQEVFLIALAAGSVLLTLLLAGFSGAARLLASKNRRLTSMNRRLNDLAGDLHAREARFRSLVQNSSDVVVVVTPDGRVAYESDAVRPVLGHDPGRALGRSFDERVHADDASRLRSLFADLVEGPGRQRAAELRMRHADGTWRWVEVIGQDLSSDDAVGGVVLNFRDVTDRKRLEEQLQHEAFHDPLTGLANRALFKDRVNHALSRSSRSREDIPAVLFIDLDDFKLVNDSLGHDAGDDLLTAVAERIRGCLRRQDTPARLGGDEFAILVEEADVTLGAEVAERILESLRQPFTLQARQLFVQASVGIALASESMEPEAADHLLRNADAAMYTAKAHGKNRYEFFEARMHARALQRLELRERLESAIEAGDLVVHYQPVVDLVTGATVGAEALVRWRQADGTLTPPADFIPVAEETGLIVELGLHVLEHACLEAASWPIQPSTNDLTLAVNASSRQLREPRFAETVGDTLARSGLRPDQLVLEVTESALLDVGDATITCIDDLKQLGVRIALDDFGTGYSSLSHLRRFPIDILKIDRSFVADIDRPREDDRALVQSIVRLARSLKLETVAEGIERAEQHVRLRALGVQLGQGYLFAHPMEPSAFRAHLTGEVLRVG